MFCPKCRDEFRPGFTRCAACDVDLVVSLDVIDIPGAPPDKKRQLEGLGAGRPREVPHLVPMADYCGFLGLDDAREARNRLHGAGIRSEIAIRDSPDSPSQGSVSEEYWLRVERDGFVRAAALLSYDAAAEADRGAFECGECGASVPEDAERCPGCGARFEGEA